MHRMGVVEHSTLPSPMAPKIIRSRPTTPVGDDAAAPQSDTQSKPKPKPARPPPPSRPTKPPTRPTGQPIRPGGSSAPAKGPVEDSSTANESEESSGGCRRLTRQRPTSTAGVSYFTIDELTNDVSAREWLLSTCPSVVARIMFHAGPFC